MTWAGLYPWLLVLHVLSAFAFLAVHGVSMGVWWRVRRERDRARLVSLLGLSAELHHADDGRRLPAHRQRHPRRGRRRVVVQRPVVAVGVDRFAGRHRDADDAPAGRSRWAARAGPWRCRARPTRWPGSSPRRSTMPQLERLLTDRRPTIGAAIGIAGIVVITWLMEDQAVLMHRPVDRQEDTDDHGNVPVTRSGCALDPGEAGQRAALAAAGLTIAGSDLARGVLRGRRAVGDPSTTVCRSPWRGQPCRSRSSSPGEALARSCSASERPPMPSASPSSPSSRRCSSAVG